VLVSDTRNPGLNDLFAIWVENVDSVSEPAWIGRTRALSEPHLPNARRICREVPSLPMSAETTVEHVRHILDAISRFFEAA